MFVAFVRRLRPGDDTGAVAVMVALLMVVLVGSAALAVDIGRARVVAEQVQKAADAAALAGAAYLPTDLATARRTAAQVAAANLAVGLAGAPSVSAQVGGTPTSLVVRVSAPMSYVFGPVLGITGTDVVRTATAELAGPATVAGRCNVLGREDMAGGGQADQASVGTADCAGPPSWLLASGAGTNSGAGDAYGSRICTTPDTPAGIEGCSTPASSGTNPGSNATYDPAGMLYTVQVARAGTLTLQGYDLPWVATGEGCTENLSRARLVTNPFVPDPADAAARYRQGPSAYCAGDTQPAWPQGDLTAGRTVITVRGPSASALDPAAGPVLCRLDLPGWGDGYATPAGPLAPTPPATAALRLRQLLDVTSPRYSPQLAQYFHRWASLCPSTLAVQPGTYTIQVQTVGGGGQNRYALRAALDGGGTGVTLSASGRVAMVTALPAGSSTVPVLRVGGGYAGRTVTVRAFGLGAAATPVTATFLAPDGAPYPQCQAGGVVTGPLAPCAVTPAVGDRWQSVSVSLPVDYSCSDEDDPSACWVTARLDSTAAVADTVTWQAYANGNAVRLAP